MNTVQDRRGQTKTDKKQSDEKNRETKRTWKKTFQILLKTAFCIQCWKDEDRQKQTKNRRMKKMLRQKEHEKNYHNHRL